MEVFGKAVPYLVAVDDPHSALSPVDRWGPTPVAEATIRKGLGLRTPVTALKLMRGPSGRVANVQVVTAAGTTKVSGRDAPLGGGLRSTWITALGSLSLSRPGGPAVYGKALTVTGKAQGIKGAVVSQRIDGVWQPLPGLVAKVKALSPTSFRISAGKVAGPVLKIPVAPLVQPERPRGGCPERSSRSPPARSSRCSSSTECGWRTGATSDEEGRVRDGRARARATRPHRAGGGLRGGAFRAARALMNRFALVVLAAALLAPSAEAARYAVGAASVADLPRLQRALGPELGEPCAAARGRRRACDSAAAVAHFRTRPTSSGSACRRLSSVPNDPVKQWHLTVNRAFDFWDAAPTLPPVRVAVIDSGIDATHPEFEGKISTRRASSAAPRVSIRKATAPSSPGLIAAGVDNAIGIAGMAPSAELLVAKVVDGDDLIDVEAEVKAIQWAVEKGAKVINMSLGGFRDPRNPDRDAFSSLEAAAIGYAHGKGVVIVAAVGNSDEDPPTPWPYPRTRAGPCRRPPRPAAVRPGAIRPHGARTPAALDPAGPGAGPLRGAGPGRARRAVRARPGAPAYVQLHVFGLAPPPLRPARSYAIARPRGSRTRLSCARAPARPGAPRARARRVARARAGAT